MKAVEDRRVLREALEERDLEVEILWEGETGEEPTTESRSDDPTWGESTMRGDPIVTVMNGQVNVIVESTKGYKHDQVFKKVLASPMEFKTFSVKPDGLIYTKNRMGNEVVCILHVRVEQKFLTEWIIEQAHLTIGHMGPQKTDKYIRQLFWWPCIGLEVHKYCDSCGTCQTVKSSTARPRGLLHSMPIPTRPWGSIGMDFVGPFPPSHGFDYLWVVIC